MPQKECTAAAGAARPNHTSSCRPGCARCGLVDDNRDRDRGWTVELAFPWRGLAWLAKPDQRSLPPKEGDVWRMDFSRFNTYKEAPPAKDSGAWVWTRHGIWDSHIPECFAHIHFTTNDVSTAKRPEQR